uniref:Uncharacterized protein n=1 Tax=Nelumbo nucifera TaxID=4432 RepID=A0A822Y375_NELNU|nr:TPA_asm: hypothetical protein HUJ06_028180 [Nelumbo nucifera]
MDQSTFTRKPLWRMGVHDDRKSSLLKVKNGCLRRLVQGASDKQRRSGAREVVYRMANEGAWGRRQSGATEKSSFSNRICFSFFEHGKENGREQSTGWLMEEHWEEDYHRFQTEE